MPDNQSHSAIEPETPVNEGAKVRLTKKIQSLDDPTCAVLETIVSGLSARFVEVIDAKTDIVTESFAKNFRTRLQLHHATHEEVFKKKTFEYAFKAASIVAGRSADMDDNVTIAGYDLMVDDVRFSLKTEAGKTTSGTHIKISKLMEARWIRECRSGKDYLSNMEKVKTHLSHYDRIITLRAFRVDTPFIGVRYDLWEIPHQLLSLVSTIKARDFTSRMESCTSTVIVKLNGTDAFKLRLDGSVEKITLEKLPLTMCRKHASWSIESLVMDSESD